MHPNPVARGHRANPADFPALSRGSAAPTFVEAWKPKDRQEVVGMPHAPKPGARQTAADPVRTRISSATVVSGKSPMARLSDRPVDPSAAPAIIKSRAPRGFFEAITEAAAAGRIVGTAAGSRVGPVGALFGAFVFGGAWIWNRTRHQDPNRSGA
jgi:hypothetical protein